VRWNAALAGLAASWGFIAVIIASLELDAGTIVSLRLALAAATLGFVAVAAGQIRVLAPRGRLLALAAVGVVQAAHWLLFVVAVIEGSVALALLTFYTAPIMIALVAPFVLGERLSSVAVASFVVGAGGIILIALTNSTGGWSGWALAAGLGSAATYALLVLLTKRLLRGDVPALRVAFWDCLVGAAVTLPLLALGAGVAGTSAADWGLIVLLGVVFTGFSTLVYALLLGRVTALVAGVLTFLEPVSGVFLAWLLLEQEPGAATLVGGALVVSAGIAVVILEPADAARDTAAVGSSP
jgi:drug/metabolite transporter (DMT)-like permease